MTLPGSQPYETVLVTELLLVAQAISRPSQWRVYETWVAEGCSFTSAADSLGVSKQAVHQVVSSVRRRIKAYLEVQPRSCRAQDRSIGRPSLPFRQVVLRQHRRRVAARLERRARRLGAA